MTKTEQKKPGDFIVPLDINGLQGRMMRLPAPIGKSREILFVYGHHSSLERWWGVLQDLNQYGAVTTPDLPGFGGMDSFYKIGKQPSIDNFADYLATFIKLRYKRGRVSIVGLSFGFVVVTRMLQRYPDLAKKVDLLISVVGFAHKSDFTFTKKRYHFYLTSSKMFSRYLPAIFFQNVCVHPLVLRLAYAKTHNAKTKFEGMSKGERRATMDFEIELWRINDVRTQWATTNAFLRLDNCQVRVDLPVVHISVKADRYFDNHSVEQHLRVIFNDFGGFQSRADSHAPSVIADQKTAAALIPPEIRKLLSQKP